MASNILLVDDSPEMIQVMARMLKGLGQLRYALGGQSALRLAREAAPDLVLLDAEMPEMDGYQVCEAFKADPALQHVPIIFVTAHDGAEFEVRGLEAGAVDFIAKPISERLLLARVKTQLRLKLLADELRQLATLDSLTGVANRRSFDDTFQREWQRGVRHGDPISLLLVDVDHFKLFNDFYGHPAGDACLRAVADALRSVCLRPADLLARYGGEEFVLLLPQTPRAGAEKVAQLALRAVAAAGIGHEASPTCPQLTISLGAASYERDNPGWIARGEELERSAEGLLLSADQALYRAKRSGRAQAWWVDAARIEHSQPVPPRPSVLRPNA